MRWYRGVCRDTDTGALTFRADEKGKDVLNTAADMNQESHYAL